MTGRWVRDPMTPKGSRTELFHLDGTPWYEAPVPKRRHRCTAQTWGWADWFRRVERCACGAIRDSGRGVWAEVNTRSRPKVKRRWWQLR